MCQSAPMVSIIIPVYNVEKYLRMCLKSITNQFFDDFEVILVDDGSNDGSELICEEFARDNSCFRIIHQQNSGSSNARNSGLRLAKGKYIYFCDSDDWVDNDHLSILVNLAESKQADLVISAYSKETEYRTTYVSNKPCSLKPRTIIIDILKGTVHAGLWNKLVKREIVERYGICFPSHDYYEDMYFTVSLLNIVHKIVYSPSPTYHYRITPTSLTNSTDTMKRIKMYTDFIANISEVFNKYSLWGNIEMVQNLYYHINLNKLRLLECSDTQMIKDIINDSYPESIKYFRMKGKLSLLNYLALKYKSPLPLKIRNKLHYFWTKSRFD